MPQIPSETPGNPRIADSYASDEARLLATISGQLSRLQETADRFEEIGREFLPAARALLSRRSARAAAAASSMFTRGS